MHGGAKPSFRDGAATILLDTVGGVIVEERRPRFFFSSEGWRKGRGHLYALARRISVDDAAPNDESLRS